VQILPHPIKIPKNLGQENVRDDSPEFAPKTRGGAAKLRIDGQDLPAEKKERRTRSRESKMSFVSPNKGGEID